MGHSMDPPVAELTSRTEPRRALEGGRIYPLLLSKLGEAEARAHLPSHDPYGGGPILWTIPWTLRLPS
jgi:hypothetical protein